jgi:hypothetical protein
MREAFVILIAIAILLIFVAIEYRRQIVGVIRFYKQFQAVRRRLAEPVTDNPIRAPQAGIQLVKCERCNKWIPETSSVKVAGKLVCRTECRVAA